MACGQGGEVAGECATRQYRMATTRPGPDGANRIADSQQTVHALQKRRHYCHADPQSTTRVGKASGRHRQDCRGEHAGDKKDARQKQTSGTCPGDSGEATSERSPGDELPEAEAHRFEGPFFHSALIRVCGQARGCNGLWRHPPRARDDAGAATGARHVPRYRGLRRPGPMYRTG